MRQPAWVPLSVVLAMHDQLLVEHGGSAGVRDQGLLESALARPQQLMAYKIPDVFELAAAYVVGIVRNHPFVDGNKRTAFMTGYVFLARHNAFLEAPEPEATQIVLDLAERQISEEQVAQWLRKRCKRRRQLA